MVEGVINNPIAMLHRPDVQHIVTGKTWYGYDSETGAPDWSQSIDNLAHALKLDPDSVNDALARAFTPACLSQIHCIDNGQNHISLLQALSDIGITPHVWTEGPLEWQRTKFERTGASELIPANHFHCFPCQKKIGLGPIITTIHLKGKRQVIVVDDKGSNLQDALALRIQSEVPLAVYEMNLHDPLSNADAFYTWLQTMKNPLVPTELVLDFDGVIIDTNDVLSGPATDNLCKLLHSAHRL